MHLANEYRAGLVGPDHIRQLAAAAAEAATAIKQGWHTIPLMSGAVNPTNGAAGPDLRDIGARHKGLAYDTATPETGFFSLPMPPSYNGGAIRVRLFVATLSTVGQTAWTVAAAGGSLEAAMGTGVGLQAATTSSGVEVETAVSGNITPGGSPAGGKRLVIAITRAVADSYDTYAADAYIMGGLVFYQVNAGADL